MAKEEGVKTVVVGGKAGVPQEYCGTVGGQSTDFSTMDTEIKVRTPDPSFHKLFLCSDPNHPMVTDYSPQKQHSGPT